METSLAVVLADVTLLLLVCANMAAQPFDAAFEGVKHLAGTFNADEGRYLSSEYQEAEARKDFIDKFFYRTGLGC